MRYFKPNKRILSAIVATFMIVPSLMAQDNGYNFTNIDVPVEPVYNDGATGRYTENLWEVTSIGVFNEDGYQVDEFSEDPADTLPSVNLNPNGQDSKITKSPAVPEIQESFEDYRQSLIMSWGGKKSFAERRLSGVEKNLDEQKKRFADMEESISEAEEKLAPVRKEVELLQGQIDLINNQIRITRKKITNVEVMIAEKQIEIKDAMLFLQRSEIELDIQKKIVMDYVNLLYEEENRFFDLYDEGSSTLKLLLADNSVSENLLGAEYFSVMEQTGRKVFNDLNTTRLELLEKQDDILKESEDLEFLYEQLNKEKRSYEETRLSKKDILEKTRGEEERYTLLLEESLQQQLEAAIAVQNLQDNIQLIESKLDILDDGLGDAVEAERSEDFEELQEKKEALEMIDSIDGRAEEDIVSANSKQFIWPVTPNKITTEFQDPYYPKKWGIHNAIDMRARQYSEIRAPANAYVFQTKDSATGYNYIVLAHKNNLVTVYGHVSEILVTPGTTVRKGELIGYTGGTPGTKGAGLQTTGPHIHFEVYYKGEPVDPLKYLPLEEMPIEYVPDEYLEELK